jgi:hypothetical protein
VAMIPSSSQWYRVSMMFLAALLGLFNSIGQASSIDALDSILGTTSVSFSEQRRQGSFIGCSMEYKAIIRDHVYAKGAPYTIVGSLSVSLNKDNLPVLGLKIGTHRIDVRGNDLEFIPQRPFFSYLASPQGQNNAREVLGTYDSDTEGSKFFVFDFSEHTLALLLSLKTTKQLKIYFNRHEGGTDVEVPIDLRVIDTKSNGSRTLDSKEVDAFHACTRRAIKSFLESR